jgi:TonB family protein
MLCKGSSEYAIWEKRIKHNCQIRGGSASNYICVVLYGVLGVPLVGNAQEGVASREPEPKAQVVSKPHIDPVQRLRFHNGVYPPLAMERKEDGVCWVRTMVDSDGHIRATQLLRSTGSASLDEACLFAFPGQRLIPASVDGSPVIAWMDIPNVWKLSNVNYSGRELDRRPPIPESVPRIKGDYHLHVGPSFYPIASAELGEKGDCIVSMQVSDVGAVAEVRVVLSTKFPALDQACVDAAAKAEFTPGQKDGKPISSFTYLAMYWDR